MSSQKVEIASWNIADGLNSPERASSLLERIVSLDADVVALPEAFSERLFQPGANFAELETLLCARETLRAAGYGFKQVKYDDKDTRKDRHAFMLLVRRGVAAEAVRHVSLDSRQTLAVDLADLPLSITGVHLDDRSEDRRVWQTSRLIEAQPSQRAHVLMGDFNAMHRGGRGKNSPLVRPLVAAYPFTHLLPASDPGEQAANLPRLRRVGSLAQRLSLMASGRTMRMLERNGYLDADPQRQPTLGRVQLDHILTDFWVNEHADYVNLSNFQVLDTTKATESDHRIIRATIEY